MPSDRRLRASLEGTGLDLSAADVDADEETVDLWLEDVRGTAGVEFADRPCRHRRRFRPLASSSLRAPDGVGIARLGAVASCVKYAWLLPLLLQRASAEPHSAYHQRADAGQLYRQRGIALSHLAGWCDEALELIG